MSTHIINTDHAPLEHFSLSAPAGRRRNLVSLTPLIDVVFILLIFFMLASNFFDWQQLPLTTSITDGVETSDGDGLYVLVAANGELSLNDERLSLPALEREVRLQLRNNPQLTVQLEPRPGVALQELIGVFDRLVINGARQLSLVAPPLAEGRITPDLLHSSDSHLGSPHSRLDLPDSSGLQSPRKSEGQP